MMIDLTFSIPFIINILQINFKSKKEGVLTGAIIRQIRLKKNR